MSRPVFYPQWCLVFGVVLGGASTQAFAHNLIGIWRSACPEAGFAQSTTLNFSQAQATWDWNIYESETCAKRSYVQTYQLNFAADAVNPRNTNLMALDVTVRSASIRPLTADATREFKRTSFCGYSDWELNQAHDVTGVNCGGVDIPRSGTKLYSTYQVTGGNELRMGQFTEINDGSTPDTRPVEVDTSVVYVKTP